MSFYLEKLEEKNITDCLKSIGNFADEIIVIDMYSIDKIIEIAKNLGAKVFQNKIGLFIILLIGLILRLINLNQSLWLDEAINVMAVKTYGLRELINNYALGDYHPPLYHPILWFWVKIFGSSEISVRLPSVIFGVVMIYLTYLIGKELFREKKAWLPAFFMTIAPYQIYFSQEARMYALEGLLGTAAVYFFLKITQKETVINWLSYTFFITLAIYVDYFGFFLPLIPLFYFLISKDFKRLRSWFIASFTSALCWLPWLPLFFKQFNNAQRTAVGIPGWAKVVGSATFKNLALTFIKFSLGRISFDNKILYGSITIVVFLFFGFLFFKGRKLFKKSEGLLLLLWLFVPVIVSFLISLFTPIYQPFRLLFLLPVFYLFLSAGIFSLTRTWQKILGGLLITLISLGGLLTYYLKPRFYREDWRTAVRVLEQRARQDDLIVFVSDGPMSPYLYYQKKNLKAIGTNKVTEIDTAKRIFLFRYLWPVFDPNDNIKKMIEKNFRLIEVKEFNGVEWWEYKIKNPLQGKQNSNVKTQN